MNERAISPTALDIYRDGGSLSVSFLDSEGIERTLFFPVHLSVDNGRRFERIGYFAPQIEWFVRTPRISHVTGLESVDTTKETKAVSWEEARRILSELSPQIQQLKTEYAHVFPLMVEVAEKDGLLSGSA